MSFVKKVIEGTEKGVVKELEGLVYDKELRKLVLREAKETAVKQAAHSLDNSIPPLPEIPGILADSDERDEYLLILDYLESLGLKLTPTVLRYESQHPEVRLDRKMLAKQFELRHYDKTPLLVQLIQERLDMLAEEAGEGI